MNPIGFTFGATVGGRYWLERRHDRPSALLGLVLDYNAQWMRHSWRQGRLTPGYAGGERGVSHGLGLLARIEMSAWDGHEGEHLSVPDWSLYLAAGPVAQIAFRGGAPGYGVGYRVSVGLAAFHIAHTFPIQLEVGYEDHRFDFARVHGVTVRIGSGL
jgi:hypothetical protein